MIKICTKCKLEKDESEFYFKSSKIKKRKHSECKTCFKNRMLERTKIVWDKTKEIIGDSCKNCGYNRCSAALEFHHLDPDKKDFQISKSRSRNFEKIKTEIEKCILLCANCHREVHSGILILEV